LICRHINQASYPITAEDCYSNLLGLASNGVCIARNVTIPAVGSYPAISTLRSEDRGIFSAALSMILTNLQMLSGIASS